jgi:hypothetical protein
MQTGVDRLSEDNPPDVVYRFEDVERLSKVFYRRLSTRPPQPGRRGRRRNSPSRYGVVAALGEGVAAGDPAGA